MSAELGRVHEQVQTETGSTAGPAQQLGHPHNWQCANFQYKDVERLLSCMQWLIRSTRAAQVAWTSLVHHLQNAVLSQLLLLA